MPRQRHDILQMCPAEIAIREAILEVEKLPASAKLTSAVMNLIQAKELVGDCFDATLGEAPDAH